MKETDDRQPKLDRNRSASLYHSFSAATSASAPITPVLQQITNQLTLEAFANDFKHLYVLFPAFMQDAQLRSLLLYDRQLQLAPRPPFYYMQQLLAQTHFIMNYPSYAQALCYLLGRRYYKIPCASLLTTFFPVEAPNSGPWVNIRKINDLSTSSNGTRLHFDNGFSFQTSVGKRTINDALALAYRCSAIILHEFDLSLPNLLETPLPKLIQVPLRPYNQKIFEKLHLTDYFAERSRFTYHYTLLEFNRKLIEKYGCL